MTHLVFQGTRVLIRIRGGLYLTRERPESARDPHGGPLSLDPAAGTPLVLEWPEDVPPPGETAFQALRPTLGVLSPREAHWAGRGRQLLEWRRHHRFCGRCGAETVLADRGTALGCPECGLAQFPRVAPAVIVLVHDGERALLGRGPQLPGRMYSTLAGFVEAGESVEETVHREIMEEAGVRVGDLRYFGSQPWPFPHSLMLGFHARYVGGVPTMEEEELEDLRWFHRDRLPEIPPPETIARQLIDQWRAGLDAES